VSEEDHIKESAAEVAALIPRHAWTLMDEDQRDALMRDVVLARYMAITADGVKLGPKWWAEAVGASSGAIQKRVERLRQSQKSADETTTGRSETERRADRATRQVMRDPQKRRVVLAELDSDDLRDIVEQAEETVINRARAQREEDNTEVTLGKALKEPGGDPSRVWSDSMIISLRTTALKLRSCVRTHGLILGSLDIDKALRYLAEAESEIANVRAVAEEQHTEEAA
jgi:hypothetical protein